MNLLTSSRMRCFRECARKHQLAYVEGWRPAVEPEYFRFGTLIHKGLEGYWQAIRDGGDALDWALTSVEGLAIDPYEQARVEELLRGYVSAWESTDRVAYEVIGVELEFRAPVLNPATDLTPSRTWQLAGKIDLLLRRKSDQRVLVGEHKTTSVAIETEEDHYWSTLAIDHQISCYVVGAESLGHPADEILYDVLKKPMQRQLLATPAEARKFTKDGRLYANQRENDETPDEYRARVRAVLEESPTRYYQRRAIPRTQSQVRDFLFDAWQQARAMRDMELEGFAPRNPESCHRFGACAYWSLCSTGSEPDKYPGEFVLVENVHPELEVR